MPILRTFLTFRLLIFGKSRILTPLLDCRKYAQDLCKNCVFTAYLRSALLSAVSVMAASDAMTLTCNEIFHFFRYAANRGFVHNQHIWFPMHFQTYLRIARLSPSFNAHNRLVWACTAYGGMFTLPQVRRAQIAPHSLTLKRRNFNALTCKCASDFSCGFI